MKESSSAFHQYSKYPGYFTAKSGYHPHPSVRLQLLDRAASFIRLQAPGIEKPSSGYDFPKHRPQASPLLKILV
jgi:hypothetical protein